jgi:hypothetical protein
MKEFGCCTERFNVRFLDRQSLPWERKKRTFLAQDLLKQS